MSTAPTVLALTSLSIVLGTVATPAQVSLRPGRYEVTAEMNLAGFPSKPQTDVDCLTERDVADLTRLLLRDESTEGCKTSNVKWSGSTLTFDTECDVDGERYGSTVDLTFTPDTYKGTMRMTMSDGKVTVLKMSARRVGECR